MSFFVPVEALAAELGHGVGASAELKFPDGWDSGWIIAAVIGAVDRPYRLIARKPGREIHGAAPECVRVEGGAR